MACTIGVEDNRLATDARSASHCMDSDRQYVLRRLKVGKVPVLMRYRVGCTALVPHLQLWHSHRLASTVHGRSAFTTVAGITLPVS